MNIDRLSKIEYKYLYNINDIVEARLLSQQRLKIVQESNYWSESIKNTVKQLSNEFDTQLCHICRRDKIHNSEDYSIALDAALIANCDIQILIKRGLLKSRYKKISKTDPIYNELQTWDKIHIKLGAKSWAYIQSENHNTFFAELLIGVSFLGLSVTGMLTNNVYLFLLGIIALVIVLILSIKYNKRLLVFSEIDQMNRLKNSIQYKSKMLLKSTKHELFDLLLGAWKKL